MPSRGNFLNATNFNELSKVIMSSIFIRCPGLNTDCPNSDDYGSVLFVK